MKIKNILLLILLLIPMQQKAMALGTQELSKILINSIPMFLSGQLVGIAFSDWGSYNKRRIEENKEIDKVAPSLDSSGRFFDRLTGIILYPIGTIVNVIGESIFSAIKEINRWLTKSLDNVKEDENDSEFIALQKAIIYVSKKILIYTTNTLHLIGNIPGKIIQILWGHLHESISQEYKIGRALSSIAYATTKRTCNTLWWIFLLFLIPGFHELFNNTPQGLIQRITKLLRKIINIFRKKA